MVQVSTPVILGGDKPHYKLHIMCAQRGIDMLVDMPEQLTLALSAEWENRFGASLMSIPGAENIVRGLGANTILQEYTKQIWTNSTPLELPLQIIFDAEESGYKDVYLPMTKLLELNVPIKKGAVLIAPGPWMNHYENAVSIRLGNLLFIPDGIATSVQAQFDARLDDQGFPISGQIDITIRTSQVYSDVEWRTALAGGTTNTNTGGR